MKFRNLARFIVHYERDTRYNKSHAMYYFISQSINGGSIGYDITYTNRDTDSYYDYNTLSTISYDLDNSTFYIDLNPPHSEIRFQIIYWYNHKQNYMMVFNFNKQGELVTVFHHHVSSWLNDNPKYGWSFKYDPSKTDKSHPNAIRTFYRNSRVIKRIQYRSPIYKLPDSMLLLAEKIYARP